MYVYYLKCFLHIVHIFGTQVIIYKSTKKVLSKKAHHCQKLSYSYQLKDILFLGGKNQWKLFTYVKESFHKTTFSINKYILYK